MRRVAAALFFLSGACGLVYEVVWTRMLTHVFGGTALAIGTVLAAFMTGLALGGFLLGRVADRVPRPLRFYAYLEIGVALAAGITHLSLTRIAPAYVAAYPAFEGSHTALAVVRFLMAFTLIVAPTAVMGATLPVLARFFVRRISTVGSELSTLYSINTLGAVAGSLASGFFLIGTIGVHGAAAVAIAGNAAVGIVAWVASVRMEGRASAGPTAPHEETAATPDEGPRVAPATYRLVLAGLAVSGMTSFAYEVFWARCLHFITGNSTYAVTTTLVAFLSGIALGGFLVRFAMRPGRDPAATFGWIQVAIAASAATAMPALFTLLEPEAIRLHTWGAAGGFWSLVASRFGIAFGVMFVPAALIGATFPLAGRLGVRALGETGASVGRIYALNTVGNVLGALLPGLVLIHWIGIRNGILAMAALNLAVGLALLFFRMPEVRSLRWAGPAALAAAGLLVFALPREFRFPLAPGGPWYRVLYERDGPSATTAVLLNPETREKAMTVDGVAIGGTGVTDYKQQLLAHLPKLLLDDVSRELSVGLGSAMLVGESARHARVRAITCVEIEPTVVEGSAWFGAESGRVLADPRVRIVVDDVANHLRTTRNVYDVVSADEKTADEFASNGFSYSRDYYALLRRRLAPGGLVIQWVPTELPPRQYRMVLKTFCDAFPHVLMWYFGPALMSGTGNTVLVGSVDPIDPNEARAARWMKDEADAFGGMTRYGLSLPDAVFAQLWARREAIARAVEGDPVNTLSHPRYEFYAPSDYAVSSRRRLAENFDFLLRLRAAAPETGIPRARDGSSEIEFMRTLRAAEAEYLAGCRILLHDGPPRAAVEHLERAVASAPWNENLRARVFAQYWDLAGQFLAVGNPTMAEELDRMALRIYDKHPMSHVEYAALLGRRGDVLAAIDAARRGLALDPNLVAGHRLLAELLGGAGRREEARAHWRAILELEPDDAEAKRQSRSL